MEMNLQLEKNWLHVVYKSFFLLIIDLLFKQLQTEQEQPAGTQGRKKRKT